VRHAHNDWSFHCHGNQTLVSMVTVSMLLSGPGFFVTWSQSPLVFLFFRGKLLDNYFAITSGLRRINDNDNNNESTPSWSLIYTIRFTATHERSTTCPCRKGPPPVSWVCHLARASWRRLLPTRLNFLRLPRWSSRGRPTSHPGSQVV